MARSPSRKGRAKPSAFSEVREGAQELINQIIRYFVQRAVKANEIIFVPASIFTRIMGTHDTIELLLDKGHVVDAAVIALTQLELRVQLAWTAQDIKNATQWVDHSDLFNTPRKILTTITELFADEADQTRRLRTIFTHLSGVKHANPVMSELAFSGRSTEGGLTLFTRTRIIDDEFSKRFARLLRDLSIYQLAWCAQVISIYVARYAEVDRELRERLRHIGLEHQSSEAALVEFMEEVTKRQQGFFGLRAKKQR